MRARCVTKTHEAFRSGTVATRPESAERTLVHDVGSRRGYVMALSYASGAASQPLLGQTIGENLSRHGPAVS